MTEVRARLADDACEPHPVQRPVQIMVGPMSAPGLAVAARHADVVGLAGLRQVPGAAAGTFRLSSTAETQHRVDQVRREAAGGMYRSQSGGLLPGGGVARRHRTRSASRGILVHEPHLFALPLWLQS